MNIPDHISKSLETIFGFKRLKFIDADPDPGSGIFFTLDPRSGMEKFGSGIRDKHPGSATLHKKIYISFASLKGMEQIRLDCSGVYGTGTHFLHALGTGGNVRGNKQTKPNQNKPHQTHRCHRRGRCR
jgi:hypothetical protein